MVDVEQSTAHIDNRCRKAERDVMTYKAEGGERGSRHPLMTASARLNEFDRDIALQSRLTQPLARWWCVHSRNWGRLTGSCWSQTMALLFLFSPSGQSWRDDVGCRRPLVCCVVPRSSSTLSCRHHASTCNPCGISHPSFTKPKEKKKEQHAHTAMDEPHPLASSSSLFNMNEKNIMWMDKKSTDAPDSRGETMSIECWWTHPVFLPYSSTQYRPLR